MKRPIAILFMLLMCLQAIPVLDFFSTDKIFYAYVDEDKPEETKLKEKKEDKQYTTTYPYSTESGNSLKHSDTDRILSLPSPYLESFTPPPNTAC
jgi:hypothetical protein